MIRVGDVVVLSLRGQRGTVRRKTRRTTGAPIGEALTDEANGEVDVCIRRVGLFGYGGFIARKFKVGT